MYTAAFNELKAQFEAHADADNAVAMQNYMKGKFSFYGIKAPLRKTINRPIFKKYKCNPTPEFKNLISLLWSQEQREYQYTAMDWMERLVQKMDASWLPFLEELITKKSWWDTVDWIAANGVGRLFLNYPELRPQNCNAWIESKNIWLVRTAILHQLKHREQLDWELLQSYILKHADAKEFFINKASGWALRQYHKIAPQRVFAFVDAHPELSNLTKREALKHHKE